MLPRRLLGALVVVVLSATMAVTDVVVPVAPAPVAHAAAERVPESPVVRRGAEYHLKHSMSAGAADEVFTYGRAGDEVWFADTDGNGTDTPVVRRASTLHIRHSMSAGPADIQVVYGRAGDALLFADLDGDGTDTPVVRRGAEFHVRSSLTSGPADVVFRYGRATDQVFFADLDGDGTDTPVVRRGAEFHVRSSLTSGPADVVFRYGRATDQVFFADLDGDGTDTPVVRRGAEFHVRSSLTSGPADEVVVYGRAGDDVYFGRWKAPLEPLELELTSTASRWWSLGNAYADNTVNTAAFRRDSVTSGMVGSERLQFTAYYDRRGRVVLARRVHGSDDWKVEVTQHRGPITDAHNVISIGLDGQGYLHVAWGMHGAPLAYARSDRPGSLTLGDIKPMVRTAALTQQAEARESSVTYPQFLPTADGDLFFLYRHGRSGNGDVVLNRLDSRSQTWSRVADNLLGGEGQRSAYWQAVTDDAGRLHLSWTYRETSDVMTNWDVMYAVSTDDTATKWARSDGSRYDALPITVQDAERVSEVPQQSNLINQTHMTLDDDGNPFIATYHDDDRGETQYMVMYHDGARWHSVNTGVRQGRVDLSGAGTLALPLSRPDIAVRGSGRDAEVVLLVRDTALRGSEQSNVATVVRTGKGGIGGGAWYLRDLTTGPVHSWEPTYDTRLWQDEGVLEVYLQYSAQGNHETTVETPPARVYVVRVDLGDWPELRRAAEADVAPPA